MLLMLLGAIVAARERENQRVVTLQVTEPAHGVRMVGKLVVGEHCARRDVRTHRLDSFVAVTRIGLGRAPAMVTSHWALRWVLRRRRRRVPQPAARPGRARKLRCRPE